MAVGGDISWLTFAKKAPKDFCDILIFPRLKVTHKLTLTSNVQVTAIFEIFCDKLIRILGICEQKLQKYYGSL